MTCPRFLFQSTLLMRGATSISLRRLSGIMISIHAPHARSDVRQASCTLCHIHFNPRSSCEERHAPATATAPVANFNPRSSCEERPGECADKWNSFQISIHAPHARSDPKSSREASGLLDFNPRSSCEERRQPSLHWSA